MNEQIRSLWADGKTEVLIRRDIVFYNLGETIPAGTYARVVRRVATDAAEVECRGVRWVEIFIVDISDDRTSLDVCAEELRQQAKRACPECARSFGPHYTGPCEH